MLQLVAVIFLYPFIIYWLYLYNFPIKFIFLFNRNTQCIRQPRLPSIILFRYMMQREASVMKFSQFVMEYWKGSLCRIWFKNISPINVRQWRHEIVFISIRVIPSGNRKLNILWMWIFSNMNNWVLTRYICDHDSIKGVISAANLVTINVINEGCWCLSNPSGSRYQWN